MCGPVELACKLRGVTVPEGSGDGEFFESLQKGEQSDPALGPTIRLEVHILILKGEIRVIVVQHITQAERIKKNKNPCTCCKLAWPRATSPSSPNVAWR
jgi:hypothetical protein